MDADAHISGRFANNVTGHWDMTLADHDEHHYRLAEPIGIYGRKAVRFLNIHVGLPPISRNRFDPGARELIARRTWEICPTLYTQLKCASWFARCSPPWDEYRREASPRKQHFRVRA